MRIPNFGSEPSERTEIILCYDDDYLYVAGRLYDSEPSKIQSTSLQRDRGWNWTTDHLGLIFDTFNDNENAVLFVTTPVGSRTDLSIKNDGEGGSDKYVNSLFVSYDDKGEAETVSYSLLVTPMIKALQEQQQLIEELKARIEVLENN